MFKLSDNSFKLLDYIALNPASEGPAELQTERCKILEFRKTKVKGEKRVRNIDETHSESRPYRFRRRMGTKKRPRRVIRCSSPTHFCFETENLTTDFKSNLPNRVRLDSMLSAVSTLFYQDASDKQQLNAEGNTVIIGEDYSQQYHCLEALQSPIRKPFVLDYWTAKEIALFEAGICSIGKDFHAIHKKILFTKTTNEIVEFYYHWKRTAHYSAWKSSGGVDITSPRNTQNIDNIKF